MQRQITFLIISLLLVANAFAGTRFYRASYRDDPSSSIVIGWSDDGLSTNAQVYYDTVDYGLDYSSYTNIHGIDRTQEAYNLNNKFARISGLLPNKVYYFVIKDDEGISDRMFFKTLPNNPDEGICFISGGDSRTGTILEPGYQDCRFNRQICDSLVAKIRPDFVAFNGDFVNWGSEEKWSDWFFDWQYTISDAGRIIPIIPVLGNHEESLDMYNLFDVPNTTAYFSLGIGGNLLRFYSLNTSLEICDSTQRNWLENDFNLYTNNANEPYWKFVQYHIPFVPHANYSPHEALIDCWVGLFEQYKLRLVSEAHAHVLKVTWPIKFTADTESDNHFVRNNEDGIVYIGEGSWGAPMRNLYTYYSSEQAFEWTRNQVKATGFQVICVTKEQIEIRTVLAEQAFAVGQVELNDPVCTMPANLPLWDPANGSVVVIDYNASYIEPESSQLNDNCKFTLFPNPVIENTIQIKFESLEHNSTLEIYNSFGRKYKSINVNKGDNLLELSTIELPKGTYFIVLKSDVVVAVEKFVVL